MERRKPSVRLQCRVSQKAYDALKESADRDYDGNIGDLVCALILGYGNDLGYDKPPTEKPGKSNGPVITRWEDFHSSPFSSWNE